MDTFADVHPGLIIALANGLRQRSANAGKRPGRLADLEALAGRKGGAGGPGEIVLTDGWDGRRR